MNRFTIRRQRTVLLAAAAAACAAALASPASADPAPADPTSTNASATEAVTLPGGAPVKPENRESVLVDALDQVGIGHPDNKQAITAANNVCGRIKDGKTPAETVSELQKANPGLEHEHALAFVEVARTVYCPSK